MTWPYSRSHTNWEPEPLDLLAEGLILGHGQDPGLDGLASYLFWDEEGIFDLAQDIPLDGDHAGAGPLHVKQLVFLVRQRVLAHARATDTPWSLTAEVGYQLTLGVPYY